jgi:hypothetical protein
VLQEAAAGASSAAARAAALTELEWVHLFQADQPGGAALARRALAGSGGDAAVRAHALNCVSSALMFMLEDLEEAARLSAEAVDLAEGRADVVAVSENLCGVGYVASLRGRPEADPILRRAEDLGPDAWGWRVIGWPSFHRALVSLWTDRSDGAIALFRELQAQFRYSGDEGSIPAILAHLVLAEFVAAAGPTRRRRRPKPARRQCRRASDPTRRSHWRRGRSCAPAPDARPRRARMPSTPLP